MRTRFLPYFAILGCSGAPQTATPHEPASPEPGVAALLAAHDVAWNAHDPEALTDLFVDDATVVIPTGRIVEGRAAILQTFSAPSPTKETSSTTRIDAVRQLADTVALVTATQTLTGPGVAVLGGSQAQLVGVATEEDGKWRFAAVNVVVPRTNEGAVP